MPDIEQRLREVENEASAATMQISAHEKLCAERYAGIEKSHKAMSSEIRGINANLRWAAITLLTGMAAIIVKLQFFPGGN